MVSPALATDPAVPLTSAVLVWERSGQFTVMTVLSPELPEPALPESKLALLDSVPQVVESVALVMWTLTDSPLASSSLPQCRLWVVVAVPVTAQFEAVVAPVVVSTAQRKPVAGSGLSS